MKLVSFSSSSSVFSGNHHLSSIFGNKFWLNHRVLHFYVVVSSSYNECTIDILLLLPLFGGI